MKINFKLLFICIAIPLFTGILATLLTQTGMETTANLNKPPLSPPALLFPIVWTILYTLMGIASYLVIVSEFGREDIRNAITVYAAQLIVNFFWSLIFFGLQWYLATSLLIIVLWGLIFLTIRKFLPFSKPAAYLLLPYLAWVTFATYLTFGIWILN